MKNLILLSWVLLLAASLWSGSTRADSVVVIHTNMGDIKLVLNETQAPLAVANFLKYVEQDGYKGVIFHRVISDFMIQSGGHLEDYSLLDESHSVDSEADNGLKNLAGSIAMARGDDIDSATRQFFINLNDNAYLDHGADSCTRADLAKQAVMAERGLYKPLSCLSFGYTVFGRVIEGMNLVAKIGAMPVSEQNGFENLPDTTITILSIEAI